MQTLKSFSQAHSVSAYFLLTYLISWTGALVVAAPHLLSHHAITPSDSFVMFPVMLLGPSLSGLALTAITDGRPGLRTLLMRMGRWRVGARWYAVLLLPPSLILLVLLVLSLLVSLVFKPNLFLFGILFGLLPGFLEEIGWTGYALPKLCRGRSTLAASLWLGALWGMWHLPVVDHLGAASPHGRYWLPFAVAFVLAMTGMRVLISWLYANTESLLLAQLMHASSTAGLVVFGPTAITAAQEALWYSVYGCLLWGCAAIVIHKYGRQLVRTSSGRLEGSVE